MTASSKTRRLLGAGLVAATVLLASMALAPAATAAPDEPDPSQPKIIGGTAVPDDAYPFMVSLQSSGSSFCGGSLLAPRIVMTAAHCVTGTDPVTGLPVPEVDGITVVVGRTVLSQKNQGVERGLSTASEIAPVVVHPRYLQGDAAYDIAFLALDAPVEGIVPVKLPTKGTDALLRPGQSATVIGWGNTDATLGQYPDRLRQVSVPILSTEECEISSAAFRPDINMCAGVAGKDSCQGDSGGPLFRQPPSRHTAYQVGVVSYGDGCGEQGAPGVYVSLSSAGLWDTMAESADGRILKEALGR